MNIIKKLGIKDLIKVPCSNIKPSEACNYTAVNYELLKKKETEYSEMLEVLIKQAKSYEEIFGYGYKCRDEDYNNFDHWIKIIEKACYPKKWQEIKGLA